MKNNITQARHNFVLAFQYCWNGKEFPIFREINVNEPGDIHTGYIAIDLLDEALNLHPGFQEARDLRGDIWHAILIKNFDENYPKYIDSKAWSETREKYFNQFGHLCLCGNTATEIHHKTYENVGKENLFIDLVGLCEPHHRDVHQWRNSNGVIDAKGKAYWDKFEIYLKENGSKLQLFPEPNLPSVYGIQIDRRTRKSEDIREDGAFWLIAFRNAKRLRANLCVESTAHYSVLKEQKEIMERQFEDSLGELKWEDDRKQIGFSNSSVGNVMTANTDQEFSWLQDRLISLHKVFRSCILELQEGKNCDA